MFNPMSTVIMAERLFDMSVVNLICVSYQEENQATEVLLSSDIVLNYQN